MDLLARRAAALLFFRLLVIFCGLLSALGTSYAIAAVSGDPAETPAPNSAPQILSEPNTSAIVGQLYRYAVQASDVDEDELYFELVDAPRNMSIDAVSGRIAWAPSLDQVGSHFVLLVAREATGAYDWQAFQVEVGLASASEDEQLSAISQQLVMQEDAVLGIHLEASGAQGELLFQLLSLPQHGTVLGSPPDLRYYPKPDFFGLDELSYFVVDQATQERSQSASIQITVHPVNDAPDIVSVPPSVNLQQGQGYYYPVQVRDVDDELFTWTLQDTDPALSIDSSGRLKLNDDELSAGTYPVNIYVADAAGASAHQTFNLAVQVVAPDTLRITSTPTAVASSKVGYDYAVSTNQDGQPLQYEFLSAPPGAKWVGRYVSWHTTEKNQLAQDKSLDSCAQWNDFVIGSFGSSSLFVESTHKPQRFPRIFKPISPTLTDTTDIDNQIALGTHARLLAGEQWGFARTFAYTTLPPYWSGVLTRLVVDGVDGRALGFSNAYGDYERPLYDGQEQRGLAFHNDTFAARGSHDTCESANNFGLISGVANGTWEQCQERNWGRYGVINGMPQAGFWQSDLAFTAASVESSQTIGFTLSNRGLRDAGAFEVHLYESDGRDFEWLGSVPVEGLSSRAQRDFSFSSGGPIQGDIRLSIAHTNQESFECDTSNNSLDLRHFRIRVASSQKGAAIQDFWVATLADQLTIRNPLPAQVYAGSDYVYRAEVLGGEPPYSYAILNGPASASVSSAGELRWVTDAEQVGQHLLTLQITDRNGDTQTHSGMVSVLARPSNHKPEVLSVSPTDAVVGEEYVYQLEISDPEGDDFTIVNYSSPGVMDENLRISWTPTMEYYALSAFKRELFAGMHVEIMDSVGAVTTHSWKVNLHLDGAHSALSPALAAIPSVTLSQGDAYRFQVNATNPLSGALTYVLLDSPPGMTVSERGLLVWQTHAESVGEHVVRLRVANAKGASEQRFYISVQPRLQITSMPPSHTWAEHPFTHALDTSLPATEFRLQQRPLGMQISASGVIEWTPTDSAIGPHDVLVGAKDDQGNWTVQAFTLLVVSSDPDQNQAPVFESAFPARTLVQKTLRHQIRAFDPEGMPVTFALLQGPMGMSVNADGSVWWTPTAEQIGAHAISIEASDGLFSRVLSTSLVVTPDAIANRTPEFVGSPKQEYAVGSSVSDQIQAYDADGDPIAFSLRKGPDGMHLDFSGLVTWQPQADQAGSHVVEIAVADIYGATAVLEYSVQVPSPRASEATLSLINRPSLEAWVGQAYRFRTAGFSSIGGAVALSLQDGPEGMQIAANTPLAGYYEITWTPASACVETVDLKLVDTQGHTQSVRYSIEVFERPRHLNRRPCREADQQCSTN